MHTGHPTLPTRLMLAVSIRHAGSTAALLLALVAGPAAADPVSAVNVARVSLCATSTHGARLRELPSLDAAAARLARGESLHDVLNQLPEHPSAAASLHFAGITSDTDISHAVAKRFCRNVSSPSLSEIGYARYDRHLWIIVAASFAAPAPGDGARVESDVLRLVNDARARARRCGSASYPATGGLRLSETLSRVARAHSDDMASTDALEHEDRDGHTPADRVRRAGYAARRVGENIASGVPTAREVVDGWLASAGHCSNIMDPHFTEMGIGYAAERRSRGVIYWTQVLAEQK
jgi:uncharacterized protein YkwD